MHLRRLNEDDVSTAWLGWVTSPSVNRYLETRFHDHSLVTLRQYVASMGPFNLLAGIFLNVGWHIGNIKLAIDPDHNRGDIGLLIGPGYWGKGFATEAIGLITGHAFRTGLHKVTASAYTDNIGSIRAFEKAGFEREGVLKDHWLFEGEYQDGILLARINEHGTEASADRSAG